MVITFLLVVDKTRYGIVLVLIQNSIFYTIYFILEPRPRTDNQRKNNTNNNIDVRQISKNGAQSAVEDSAMHFDIESNVSSATSSINAPPSIRSFGNITYDTFKMDNKSCRKLAIPLHI